MASVCVNHPDREATARCVTCHKPICGQCMVRVGDHPYCSQTCADNAARFAARYRPEEGPGCFGKLKNMVVSLVGLVFVLTVLLLIGAYVFNIGFCKHLCELLGFPKR